MKSFKLGEFLLITILSLALVSCGEDVTDSSSKSTIPTTSPESQTLPTIDLIKGIPDHPIPKGVLKELSGFSGGGGQRPCEAKPAIALFPLNGIEDVTDIGVGDELEIFATGYPAGSKVNIQVKFYDGTFYQKDYLAADCINNITQDAGTSAGEVVLINHDENLTVTVTGEKGANLTKTLKITKNPNLNKYSEVFNGDQKARQNFTLVYSNLTGFDQTDVVLYETQYSKDNNNPEYLNSWHIIPDKSGNYKERLILPSSIANECYFLFIPQKKIFKWLNCDYPDSYSDIKAQP